MLALVTCIIPPAIEETYSTPIMLPFGAIVPLTEGVLEGQTQFLWSWRVLTGDHPQKQE